MLCASSPVRSVSRVASCRLQVSTTGAPSVSYAKMKSSPRAAPYHVPSPSLSAFYGNGFSSSWLDGAALPSAFALGIPAASTTSASAALSPDPPGQGTLRAQTCVYCRLDYPCTPFPLQTPDSRSCSQRRRLHLRDIGVMSQSLSVWSNRVVLSVMIHE